MKRIKIIPKPKPVPTVPTVPTVPSDEKEEDARDVEISNLKDDILYLKKELADLKTQFEYYIKKSDQRTPHQQEQHSQSGSGSGACSCDFAEWVDTLEINSDDLEKLFKSKDICEWVCCFIVDDLKKKSFEHIPICSLKGSKSDILIYISKNWTKLTDEELSIQFINKIFKKLLRSFTNWKNDNYKLIMINDKIGSIYHTNNSRILSFNENAARLKLKLFHALNNM